MTRRDVFKLSSALLIGAESLPAATCTSNLEPQTSADYDAYLQKTRAQIEVPLDPAHLPEAGSEPHVWNVNASKPNGVLEVTKGVIIHWCGAIRIKVPNVDALSRVLTRYDQYTKWYQPYMAGCHATPTGNGQYKVVTIVHDAEKAVSFLPTIHFSFEVESAAVFRTIGNTANPTLLVTNRAEKIRESDSGKPEKADSRQPGSDLMKPDFGRGALWRSDTQWRAIRSGDGIYAEYHSMSLARSIESISVASLCALLKLPGVKQKALNAMTERPQKIVTNIVRQTREACEKG